ncbi:hypothetical protein [Butyricicoccus porcorum]|uniref:hypothetical protein n=1 Tax=Butyricicoccus porcorum TaxID=1945634 RepID=UPI003F4AF1FB
MSIIELDSKVAELRELQSMISELQAEAEAIKDTIKGVMIDRGEETISGNGWKASWKNVNSSRFDSKRFKAECPDLYAEYIKQTTTCRFVLA